MDSYDPHAPVINADWLETDEGERLELVSSYHRRKKISLPNLRLHSVIHVVVENQLALEEETVVKTLARLQAEGLDRHDAIHAIGSVLAADLYELMHEPSDSTSRVYERYLERLQRLTAKGWQSG